jgi:hypothetical protein
MYLKLENAVRYGHPVLIEDVNDGNELRALEPLLMKSVIIQACLFVEIRFNSVHRVEER